MRKQAANRPRKIKDSWKTTDGDDKRGGGTREKTTLAAWEEEPQKVCLF
jgi:hypothetical protein